MPVASTDNFHVVFVRRSFVRCLLLGQFVTARAHLPRTSADFLSRSLVASELDDDMFAIVG